MTDPRDVPRLQYRPCDHCEHRHYFLTDEGDAENCPMCGGELYPSTRLVEPFPDVLLHFVQHKPRCAALEVMWHKGPCDCGLSMLLKHLLKDMPAWVKDHVGPGAVICTTCGDKGTLEQHDGTIACPNCKD